MNMECRDRTHVLKYLFSYVMKGPDWVGSELALESSSWIGFEELRLSAIDDPNPPAAPSGICCMSSCPMLIEVLCKMFAGSQSKKNTWIRNRSFGFWWHRSRVGFLLSTYLGSKDRAPPFDSWHVNMN